MVMAPGFTRRIGTALLLALLLVAASKAATYDLNLGIVSGLPRIYFNSPQLSGHYYLKTLHMGGTAYSLTSSSMWTDMGSNSATATVMDNGYQYNITAAFTLFPSGGVVNFAGQAWTIDSNAFKQQVTIEGYNQGQLSGNATQIGIDIAIYLNTTGTVSDRGSDTGFRRYVIESGPSFVVDIKHIPSYTSNGAAGTASFTTSTVGSQEFVWTVTSQTLQSGPLVFDPSLTVRDRSDIPGLDTGSGGGDSSDDSSGAVVGAVVGAIFGGLALVVVAVLLMAMVIAAAAIIIVVVVVVVVVVVAVVAVIVLVALGVAGIGPMATVAGGGSSQKTELWWVDEDDEEEEAVSSDVWDEDDEDDDEYDEDFDDYSDIDEDEL